ncbi:MAG: tRNA (5-methylaminomethyl-2-thiouridine)(34)-methyltransferase MnmD [Paracoccaceae bacterium]
MADQRPGERVAFSEAGVPVSTLFGDPYFSLQGGLAEARHVFLAGNGLPTRLCSGFRVAETGFGTGLNLLALALAWEETGRPGRLAFTSFEAHPMPPADMARAHAAFPELGSVSSELVARWAEGPCTFALRRIDVTIVEGDARATLPAWQGRADAWFLDGFSPARNPDLWTPALLADIARHTAPGGSFATYTAAGFVRRGLQAAGFQVERVPGYGTKRHMSRGILTEPPHR